MSDRCAPNESKFSTDVRDRVPVSSVGGTKAHSEVCDRFSVSSGLGITRMHVVATGFSAEVSAPLSCPLRSSKNFSESSGEKIHIPLNRCPSRSLRYTRLLHTSSRPSLMCSLESSRCCVPRTSAERDGNWRQRQSKACKRERERLLAQVTSP